MDMFIIYKIWMQHLFLIITIFCGKLNSLDLKNLKMICSYYFPYETLNHSIVYTTLPKGYCTAVSTFGEKSVFPPPGDLNIVEFKGDLPYVYIMDYYSLKQWTSKVDPTNIDRFIIEIEDLIKSHKIDVLVIDFFNDLSDAPFKVFHHDFQSHLKSFYGKIKEKYPNMLFGLKLHRGAHVVKSALNSDVIEPVVHFYMVNTYDYEICKYQNTQEKMSQFQTTPYLMQTSINTLNQIGYKAEKMIASIRISIKTFKDKDDKHGAIWSNALACETPPEPDRRFCSEELHDYYALAMMVFQKNLRGVIVEAVDCDDHLDTCGCGYFPLLQTIYLGLNEKLLSRKLSNCGI